MPERATVYEGLQLGVESTAGTAVPALKRLRGLELEITPQMPTEALRPIGNKFSTDVVRQKEHCEGTLRGQVCYTDLVYLLSSLLCEATVTTPTTNGTWTVVVGGSGMFTLTFGGQKTAAIAHNAEATAVQTALEALSTVGAGNVAVAGGAGEYVIAFTGALRDAEHTTLSGAGTGCSVVIGNAASPGGGEVTAVGLAPVSPTQVSVLLGSTFLGMAKLTRLLEATLSVQERHLPVFTLDGGEPSFSATVEGAGDPTARITVVQNSEADLYMQRLRNRTQQWCRIVANGPEIEPGFNHRLEITFPCKFTSAGRGDTEGAYTGNYDLQVIYDETAGYGLKVVVDTDLASL